MRDPSVGLPRFSRQKTREADTTSFDHDKRAKQTEEQRRRQQHQQNTPPHDFETMEQQLAQLTPEQRQALMMQAQQEANQRVMQDMLQRMVKTCFDKCAGTSVRGIVV